MSELRISFDVDRISKINEEKEIKVTATEENLNYKFIIGNDGIWSTIQDYSKDNICRWVPKEEGKYMIMVQGKKDGSIKPYDIMIKEEVLINNQDNNIIKNIEMSSTSIEIGKKNVITVVSDENDILYRFWKCSNKGWQPLRDYSVDNRYVFTGIEAGVVEIVVECKRLNSVEKFDEFKSVKFQVKIPEKTEIVDFNCLNRELLVNHELVFNVESTYSNKKNLIYKFIKLNKSGRATILQDYSSQKTIAYKEKVPGSYKILCYVKDLLSKNEYDDRAIINYDVNAYSDVKIERVMTDIVSPQVSGVPITINVKAKGGRELVYRYIIEGPISEDSGYIRNNQFVWESKVQGDYKINVYVKDISYFSEYEDRYSMDYVIDEKSNKPIRIIDIVSNTNKRVIKGNVVNYKVKVEGTNNPLYSFIVFKDGIEKERIDYNISNWVNFTPEEEGEYEVEIRVKDKYSLKEYDSNIVTTLVVYDYMPADIDYVLVNQKEKYTVGDEISISLIMEHYSDVLIRYVTKLNGRIIEDSEYRPYVPLVTRAKYVGKYSFEIYSKNILCKKSYDCKKEINIHVLEAMPVNNTTLTLDNDNLKLNNEVTVVASNEGGKQVVYEFYVNKEGEWHRVQEYSRKNYFTFVPYQEGKYKILVLAKSFYKKKSYEDYDEVEFEVFKGGKK